jgi:hypothetical protein
MASTYSTNLKIELMGLGDQSGTWGTTTNTNIGTALEQAIVGYGNPIFTTDADLTITLTDSNASQVARNFALNVTSSGSLTATRNLIVPTLQKPYLIQNSTTGSQSIVVKTSAGTGITVPNGARTLVYADGTNVVSQITQLPALALATALPVTSGGTGVTTSTGTGNTVLSTSPALTTPTLTSARIPGASTGYTTIASANTGATNYTATLPAENFTVGFRNLPAVGTKTGSYTLAVGDVGKYVQVGSGGSITIPDATFTEGDAVSIFNNTSGNITITCSITTAYIAGTDLDKATITLATRGVATVLFISGTVCVVSGTVT